MGQLFELISDEAIEKSDEDYTECHVCQKTGIDLYPYQGKATLDDGTIDDDIYAVCSDCLKTKPLVHTGGFFYTETIEKYLASQPLNETQKLNLKEILIGKYNQTPDIPLFLQRPDQPICCNDITEFTGYPADDEELYEISEKNMYWEEGLKEKSEYYDFRKYGSPESLREIASFKCRHCGEKYFTFQFT